MTSTPRTCEFCGTALEPVMIDKPFSLMRNDVGERSERIVIGYRQCKCDDAVAESDRIAAEKAQEDARREQIEISNRIASAGIPPRYADARHPQDGLWEAVKAGESLYIHGSVGTHKTLLAFAVLRRLITEGGTKCRAVDAVELMDAFKATYDRKGETEDGLSRSLSRVGVLMIDDLGKASPTDFTLSRLFRVVNDRYNNLLPMIFTTQYSRPELIERLASKGDEDTALAIVSRLCEMSRTVHMTGNDRRTERR